MTAALSLAQLTPFVVERATPFEVAAGSVGVAVGVALVVGLAFVGERRAERAGGRPVGAMLRASFRPALLGLAACGAVFVLAALASGRAGPDGLGASVGGVVLMGALYVPAAWALAVVAAVAARVLTPTGARAEGPPPDGPP